MDELVDMSWKADDATIEFRREICDSCEHKKLMICTQCGCLTAFRTTVTFFKCPISKWEQV